MGNHAYLSIFSDRRAHEFRKRMHLSAWAIKASDTAHGVVFPDAETTERLYGRQLMDSLDFMPAPADHDTEEQLDEWRSRTSGAYTIHVRQRCSFGRGELSLLCTWQTVEDTLSERIEHFFRELSDHHHIPFRVAYLHEFGVANGRIDTDDERFERIAADTRRYDELVEDFQLTFREYHDRAAVRPPEWEVLAAQLTATAENEDEDTDDDEDDEDDEDHEDHEDGEDESDHELNERRPIRESRHSVPTPDEAVALRPLYPRDRVLVAPSTLLRLIERTAYAAASFYSRHDLDRFNFTCPSEHEATSPQRLRVTATDGVRLAAADGDAEISLPVGREANVPREAIATVRRLLNEHIAAHGAACDEAPVEIQFGENIARFRFGTTTVVSEVRSSGFPSLKGLIPPALATAVIPRRDTLLRLAQLVDAFEVNVKVAEAMLTLTSTDGPTGLAVCIPCVCHEGVTIDARFALPFLADALQHLQSEHVSMTFTGDIKAFVLRELPRDDAFAVLMPRRT